MRNSGAVLLTGATGLLGRYLLRDLLASGRDVAVLVRAGREVSAQERMYQLASLWGEQLPAQLTSAQVVTGDLHEPDLGLRATDRAWLARHCLAVVHAAAAVTLRPSAGSDLWTTNVQGTRHVLDLCRSLGIVEFHHISTAFVCGDRPGTVQENDLDCGQGFHNDYERSKFEAERLVRSQEEMRVTIYRPSIIVGDSSTGYTSSYHGFYRFLELATRLAGSRSGTGNLPR
jgi:thioester reductase-like protein